ncbi:MAG: aromatic ring-hydroxylating dioxygenase subunit alpha [Emcibacter sp.]|nr:aromatic ring-hydroxylating dioxygenase subunit alpha [Emcibacter sp.]
MSKTFLGHKVAAYDPQVRGDAITGERYYSKRWLEAEDKDLWSKTWHVAGMAADLEETGDYISYNIGTDSIVALRQEDGTVKAFFNACIHRGNRLVWSDIGAVKQLACSYHGWKFGIDGMLNEVQDAEDFPNGDPCGKLKLVEISCEEYLGFIWVHMDKDATPVREWMGPIAEQLESYGMENMTRVMCISSEVDCNWKIIRDNFNEAYHIPTLHPGIATFIDDDYTDTVFEMYENGHNRMVMKGVQPSARSDKSDMVQAPLSDILTFWELNPADYEGKTAQARIAVQQQKRKLGKMKGYHYFDPLSDSQLTDYYHYTFFPNLTLTMGPDGFQVLRSDPHPTDPEKCIFEHWYMVPHIEGQDEVMTPIGLLPFEAADRDWRTYPDQTLGEVADQDLSVILGQQKGLHSRGYTGGVLTHQEKRVQRFHELLNDTVNIHD